MAWLRASISDRLLPIRRCYCTSWSDTPSTNAWAASLWICPQVIWQSAQWASCSTAAANCYSYLLISWILALSCTL
jgi:hypothetical protein